MQVVHAGEKHVIMQPFYGRTAAKSRDKEGKPVCVRVIAITTGLLSKPLSNQDTCPNCGEAANWVVATCAKCDMTCKLSACCLYTPFGLEDAPLDLELDGSPVGPESVKHTGLRIV